MPIVIEITSASCDRCGKNIPEGERSYWLSITHKSRYLGIQEFPYVMAWGGSGSSTENDLCPQCYELFDSSMKQFFQVPAGEVLRHDNNHE